MSDCWKILGLQPTTDLAAIKRAYREQVKRYHPDTVTTPEQKRRYTIICAGINDAYREAVRRVQASNPVHPEASDESSTAAPHQADDSEFTTAHPEASDAARQDQASGIPAIFKSRAALRTLVLIFFGFEILVFFTGPARNVPAAVQTLAGIFVVLFVGFIIYGLLVAGAMDLLILWFFPRRWLERLGLAKYESKLVWLTIVTVNVFVFFFTNLISHPGHEKAAVVLDLLVRAAASATIPLIFALLWLRDLIRYRQLKPDTVLATHG